MCHKCKVKNRVNQYLVDPRLEELLEELRQREVSNSDEENPFG